MNRLQGHRRAVRALAYAPGVDGLPLLASAGDDRTIRLWDLATWQEQMWLLGHTDAVLALDFAADGELLASGSRDGSLCVWDVETGENRRTGCSLDGPVQAVSFADDGEALRTVHRSPSYHAEPGRLLHWRHHLPRPPEQLDEVGKVECAAFGPGGWALAVADQDRGVAVFELGERRRHTVLRGASRVRCLAFSGPAAGLLAVAAGRVVELWDVARLQRRGTLKLPRAEVLALAFSPDGRALLTGAGDRSVRLWDVASCRERAGWDWGVGRIHALAVAPDGLTAAAGGEKTEVVVWDLD